MTTPNIEKPPICRDPKSGEIRVDDQASCQIVPAALSSSLAHWITLILSVVVLVAAYSLRIENGREVVLPFTDKALPGTCTFLRLTDLPCPGCGLTRSFISIAHGQWMDAWRYNPAGLIFFGVVAFQIPYRIYQIVRIRRTHTEHRFLAFDNWVLVVLILALIVQWLGQVVTRIL